mmetsp:Transcript_52897/g.121423  ORF Transcript_52897/g.121423 Transcript_52897/m.121423 type:complete len:207 (-) Transcript_52897:71-691(-)
MCRFRPTPCTEQRGSPALYLALHTSARCVAIAVMLEVVVHAFGTVGSEHMAAIRSICSLCVVRSTIERWILGPRVFAVRCRASFIRWSFSCQSHSAGRSLSAPARGSGPCSSSMSLLKKLTIVPPKKKVSLRWRVSPLLEPESAMIANRLLQLAAVQFAGSLPQPSRLGCQTCDRHAYSHDVAHFGKPGMKSDGSSGARSLSVLAM